MVYFIVYFSFAVYLKRKYLYVINKLASRSPSFYWFGFILHHTWMGIICCCPLSIFMLVTYWSKITPNSVFFLILLDLPVGWFRSWETDAGWILLGLQVQNFCLSMSLLLSLLMWWKHSWMSHSYTKGWYLLLPTIWYKPVNKPIF